MKKINLHWKVAKDVKVSLQYCFKRCDYRQH